MNSVVATLLTLLLVALILWAVFKIGPKVVLHEPSITPEASDEDEVISTLKSALPELLKEHGTRSLKGLMGIFEFELHKRLVVYDDSSWEKFQIYDKGTGAVPRWTVLLPMEKDSEGRNFHPYLQFDESLEANGWNGGSVYPIDYRTLYGKKVRFDSLPWEVRIFLCEATDTPLVTEYELSEE